MPFEPRKQPAGIRIPDPYNRVLKARTSSHNSSVPGHRQRCQPKISLLLSLPKLLSRAQVDALDAVVIGQTVPVSQIQTPVVWSQPRRPEMEGRAIARVPLIFN